MLQLYLIDIIEFTWKCAVDGCCLFAYQLPSKGTISIVPLIYTFSECNRQQFDMQLVHCICLKFEIMLTSLFQSHEW